MPKKPKTLRQLLKRYLAECLIDFDEETDAKHGYVLNHYEAICGPRLCDLSSAGVAKMMSTLIERGLSVTTVNGYRAKIVALWTWAWKVGWLRTWPTVRKLPEPWRAPIAWSPEEVAKIWRGIASLEGQIACIPTALWWSAYHGILFDTGERHEARMGLRWEHFTNFEKGEGTFPYSIRKGQTADNPFQFGPATMADLRVIRGYDYERVLHWPFHEKTFFPKYRKLLQHCGVPNDRYHLSHCGRKYVGTQTRLAGGNATEVLGHKDERTTNESYIDPRFIPRQWAHELLPNLRPFTKEPLTISESPA